MEPGNSDAKCIELNGVDIKPTQNDQSKEDNVPVDVNKNEHANQINDNEQNICDSSIEFTTSNLQITETNNVEKIATHKRIEQPNEKIPFENVQSNEDILAAAYEDSSVNSSPQHSSKRAISLDDIDDTVKKFITGDIIVDQENPFKQLNARRRADFFSSTPSNLSNGKGITAPKLKLSTDEYVTKEDVLKESKYVKTYIKNPDDYFVYDPTLKERLMREEQQESATKQKDRQSSTNKKFSTSRISRITNERLKELKNKYSPSPLYTQQKARSLVITNGHSSGGHAVQFTKPTYRKPGDRSKYPDLSQIKVKIGTDLDGNYFNPKEVALNAKKFDARIKNTQFGSQDDLDEIAALTSDFDANGIDEIDATAEDNKKRIVSEKIEKENDEKGESLTTTIRSKEFQKYLAAKGLQLQPQKVYNNGVVFRVVEKSDKMASVPNHPNELEVKKTKKPSVLQRLFPNGFFSSRRRTTPKDTTPEPIKIHPTDQRRDGRLSSARRLVLHRQSMPAKYDSYKIDVKTNLKTCPSGSTSSISSTLTNIEHNEYAETPRGSKRLERKTKSVDSDGSKSLSGLRYIDSSSNSTIVTCDKNKNSVDQIIVSKPTPKPRSQISARSSVPMPCDTGHRIQTPVVKGQTPVPLQRNQTATLCENTPKTRFTRPKLPIGNFRSLVASRIDSRKGEEMKVDGTEQMATNDKATMPTVEMLDRKKRLGTKLPEKLVRINIVNGNNSNYSDRQEVKTPDSNKVLDQPKSTSTPIIETTQLKFPANIRQIPPAGNSLDVSPIPKPNERNFDEIFVEKRGDRQPHLQPLIIHNPQQNVHTIPYNRRIIEMQQPIYDRLPNQNQVNAQQPVYAQVEKNKANYPVNAHFQRHTPHRQSLDQITRTTPNQAIYYQQPAFVRQSPQRNTISGVYRGNVMHRISPQMPSSPIHLTQMYQQPPRPQSVLDEMLRSREAQPSPSPSVQLRQKPPINRNEIMNQVMEFCRKSMNRTPTNRSIASMERIPSGVQKEATSSEVSPISYASVATSKTSPSIASTRSGRMEPPGVPVRKQSLPQSAQTPQTPSGQQSQEPHPIYESIVRQRPVPIIGIDSNALNGYVSHYAVPSRKFVIMSSDQVTPAHVQQYPQLNGPGSNSSINQPIYNNTMKSSLERIHLDANSYEYLNRMHNGGGGGAAEMMGNNLLQVCNPKLMTPNRGSADRVKYGASQVLPTIPQHRQMNGISEMNLPPGYTKSKIPTPKPGSIVVVSDIEQMYRPITMTARINQGRDLRQKTSLASLDSIDSAVQTRMRNGE